MKLIHHTHLKTLVLLVISATFVHAGAFLKLGDIKGEATDSTRKGWMDVHSVDWGITLKETGGSGSSNRGELVVSNLKLKKRIDSASPKIQEAVLTGVIIPLVEYELAVAGDGGTTYMKIELKEVEVTDYSMSGVTKDPISGLEVRPEEEFSLRFREIKVTYTPIASNGSAGEPVEYTWKVEEGEA